jgi:DNA-binding SARP family transcriptional activator
MPPDLVVGLETASVAILVLLLVPKRGLDHLRERFSDLRAGRRRWLFEPPPLDRIKQRKGAPAVAFDAVQAFELGVPLFVAGRLVEQRSAQLHLDRQGRWIDSPKALLAAHLKGSMTDTDLHGQLLSRGLPLPAAKAVVKKVEARPLISVKWWLERQAMARAMANSNGEGPRETAAVASVAEEEAESASDEANDAPEVESTAATSVPRHLRIRTFGRLQLLQAGQDYAPLLMAKKMLAFIWLYLFVRRLLEPEGLVNRGAFAEEYSPGLSAPKQNKRLRGRLTDINEDLPPILSSRVISDRLHLHLDLSNSSIDIVRLQEVARLCVDQKGMMAADLVAEARRMLEETEGELLPGWMDIEAETNGGRGGAKEYVRALREVAETARVDLMGSLAVHHMARQEPRKAIPLLERALEHQPDREDLARKLVAAYMETGQHTRAADLQKNLVLEI